MVPAARCGAPGGRAGRGHAGDDGGLIGAIAVFARAEFVTPAGVRESRRPFAFWILLLGIWGGLNAVFVSGDSSRCTSRWSSSPSPPCRSSVWTAARRRSPRRCAISSSRSWARSSTWPAACALRRLRHSRHRPPGEPHAPRPAAGGRGDDDGGAAREDGPRPAPPLVAAGPRQRAAAGSALLSALVVKGSFFIVLRLWFDVFPALPGGPPRELLGALGALAIVLGSVVALRQERLKLLIAYSTLAQIGYLFLMFPLAPRPRLVATPPTAARWPAACSRRCRTPRRRRRCSWRPA